MEKSKVKSPSFIGKKKILTRRVDTNLRVKETGVMLRPRYTRELILKLGVERNSTIGIVCL